MKRLLWLISLMLMTTGPLAPAIADTAQPMFAADAVLSDTGPVYWGTGFFVDWQGNVLTARHLTNDCRRIDIVGNGQRETATVIASSDTVDLSLLRVSHTFGQPAAFDPRERLPGGALVTILGYALLVDALHTQDPSQSAAFNSMVLDENAPSQIALVSDAMPGASGSPVITRDGLVAGVLASKLIRTGNLAAGGQPDEIRLAVSGAAAIEFLSQQGVAPIEGETARHARMNFIGELASAEVKIECHR